MESRIDALESREHIRHLVVRYAQALDSRDVQALAGCFTPDVRMGDGRVGRDALADWFDDLLRPYTTTFHFIGNHRIDLLDHDHANGVVYCRPEHEVGDQWIVMPMQYWDRYERQAGAWFFASRSVHAFYAADVLQRPHTVPDRFNFPGNPLVHKADLPERWESWQRFWGTGTR